MLELKKITKTYITGDTSVVALNEVDIRFEKNEFVSILGPSGCGKTTLLNIVGGLDRYTSGDLIINNKSTKSFKDKDWDRYRNHSIGFVFQSYNLISHQSVISNVEMALTLSGISKKERRKRAEEALRSVGLDTQFKKKPNQLSGGQMQRVAIARALVNNPDIILADEPTGALDSETSIQIMELLKEVAKTRLVIMVTHNPELATQYSTRIIRLKDGQVISDTKNIEEKVNESKNKIIDNTTSKNEGKYTSMSFTTALSLSFKNLLTKKARTILTSFAGSIGIIGIALILAMSNGFQTYIDKMQSDTLSNYPLTISETGLDMNALQEEMMNGRDIEEYPEGNTIYVSETTTKLQNMTLTNNITNEYIDNIINALPSEYVYGVTFNYSVTLNAYIDSNINSANGTLKEVNIQTNTTSSSSMSSQMINAVMNTSSWIAIPDSVELLNSQYDILDEGGRFPENANEFVILVNRYNQISDLTLSQLGLLNLAYEQKDGKLQVRESFTFEELKQEANFKIVDNDDLYTKDETTGIYSKKTFMFNEFDSMPGKQLKLVGIVRANKDTDSGAITSTIGYHKDFVKEFVDKQANSKIVEDQRNSAFDVLTGLPFYDIPSLAGVVTAETQKINAINTLGGKTTPSQINIFPRDFNAKEDIKDILDEYNVNKEDKDKIRYTDTTELMVSSMNTAINSISYVLIAFTSVSLVVSSIMIGIITYISVIERTKEIGILRSIGARKKDISRVFTAETLIIGFVAGLIGVGTTYLLSIPINMILYSLVGVATIATLNPIHALFLVLISMALTFVAGLFPSKIAAQKDPVVALRSE